jgi:ubiquitin-activating enzyme E1
MRHLILLLLACACAFCTPHPLAARRSPLLRLRGGGDDAAIDEGLYSRQLYVLGRKAQRSLAASSVLVVGLSGLGAEVAKNLVLAGVAELDVLDEAPAVLADLSSSFLLHEDDVGAARAERAAARLAPLNPHVRVRRVQGELDAARLASYTAVVLVDRPQAEQLRLSEAAREAGAKLVCASSRGVFGRIFCDFGDEFVVDEPDGEEPKEALLDGVEEAEDGVLSSVPEQPHGLSDGDALRLEGVGGMEGLCEEGRTFTARVLSRHTVAIGDTRGAGRYTGGGRLVQVKRPRTLRFLGVELITNY